MPAVSKNQQQAAGQALSAKRGDTPVSDLQGAAKDMYDSMSEKELEKFAKTKHDGLPEKVDEADKLKGNYRDGGEQKAVQDYARKKGEVLKGDKFNHQGNTYIVLQPGKTQSKVRRLTKHSKAKEYDVIDNKIISKNLGEGKLRRSELAQIVKEEIERALHTEPLEGAMLTEAMKFSEDQVLDNIHKALSKIKGMNGKPIRFELDATYDISIGNPNAGKGLDIKVYF